VRSAFVTVSTIQPVSQIQQEITNIFVLEQFRRAEKQSGGLLGVEVFANVQEMDDPGEQCPAFSWTDWRIVEDASFLDHRRLVVVVRAETFVVFFGSESHGWETNVICGRIR